MPREPLLVLGGLLSAVVALLHLAVIAGGPSWYRAVGAGERLAGAAERGRWTPHLVATGIAAVLLVWSAYAFSGAGLIPRLPLLRTGLVVISGIYLVRGSVLLWPRAMNRPDLSHQFIVRSSLIVLILGLAYAVGTLRAWPHLSGAIKS